MRWIRLFLSCCLVGWAGDIGWTIWKFRQSMNWEDIGIIEVAGTVLPLAVIGLFTLALFSPSNSSANNSE